MSKTEYDAVVVGSGPNGLASAIVLQREGLSVLLLEAKDHAGGGMRSSELTLPGFTHDVCSSVYPFFSLSPFFQSLDLTPYGLEMISPRITAAHPLDGGAAGVLHPSLEMTASEAGADGDAYRRFLKPVVKALPALVHDLLGPLPVKGDLLGLARFGLKALPSAYYQVHRFKTRETRALWGGMAAHGMQPLDNLTTSAFGLMLMGAAHVGNWPLPKGGAQTITDALVSCFLGLGGTLETGFEVKSLDQLPPSRATLLDVTPRQLIRIAGNTLPERYAERLQKYRYGMGVFKIDWALSEPVPFTNDQCRSAGTVHLGNTFEEIERYEKSVFYGKPADNPFVLLTQPSVFDANRAPVGKHVAWAYCHVPSGSTVDMTEAIEKQVERFAPGFRDTILARHVMNTTDMQAYNPNYIGGDINGGLQDLWQLYTRPIASLKPYRTPLPGLYLCSSSTPPGGGVHGMCGYHAAHTVLKDLF